MILPPSFFSLRIIHALKKPRQIPKRLNMNLNFGTLLSLSVLPPLHDQETPFGITQMQTALSPDPFLLGAFMGAMGITALRYALLAFRSRIKEHSAFTLLIISILALKLVLDGIDIESDWNGPITSSTQRSAHFLIPFTFLVASLNALVFLPFQTGHRLLRTLFGISALFGLEALVAPLLPFTTLRLLLLSGVSSLVVLAGITAYFWLKGFQPARPYFLSWLAIFLGSLALLLQRAGIIPVNFLSIHGLEMGSSLLVVFMSSAITDKLHRTSQELLDIQNERLKQEEENRRNADFINLNLEGLVIETNTELENKTIRLRTIFDHLKQGVCTLDQFCKIKGDYSKELTHLFQDSDLAGKNLLEILSQKKSITDDQKNLIHSAVQLCVNNDPLAFDLNAHFFPKSITLGTEKGDVYLDLDWQPMVGKNDTIDCILVTVRDRTELKNTEKLALEKTKDLNAVAQLLEHPSEQVEDFLRLGFESIHEVRLLLAFPISSSNWKKCLRLIHTLKGNARTYGFEEIASEVHSYETLLFEYPLEKIDLFDALQLEERLLQITTALDRYDRISKEKLRGGIIAHLETQLSEFRKWIETHQKDIPRELLAPIQQLLLGAPKTYQTSFQKLLAPQIKALPHLATKLSKPEPKVIIHGEDFEIPRELTQGFETIFVHLLRNTVDHGLESDHPGEIQIVIEELSDQWKITYSDSGKGLHLSKIKSKGLGLGLISEDASLQEIAELIFQSGLSSRDQVTEISGRGVGMEAVVAILHEMGGSHRLILNPNAPQDAEFRPFRLELSFPKSQFNRSSVSSHSKDSSSITHSAHSLSQ